MKTERHGVHGARYNYSLKLRNMLATYDTLFVDIINWLTVQMNIHIGINYMWFSINAAWIYTWEMIFGCISLHPVVYDGNSKEDHNLPFLKNLSERSVKEIDWIIGNNFRSLFHYFSHLGQKNWLWCVAKNRKKKNHIHVHVSYLLFGTIVRLCIKWW